MWYQIVLDMVPDMVLDTVQNKLLDRVQDTPWLLQELKGQACTKCFSVPTASEYKNFKWI